MRLTFTKMQGAGNDFVVIDATRTPVGLNAEQVRHLADRRYGVGADQVLLIEPAGQEADIDFRYRIFNSSGEEVEHCGNGARCFVRYVHDRGLTAKRSVRVQTVNNRLELHLQDDGQVRVDMNQPVFEHARIPFDATGLQAQPCGDFELWPLALPQATSSTHAGAASAAELTVQVAVLSMGNPHAVMRVDDVATAPVATLGPAIEAHARFPRRVNAGFMQVQARDEIALRVYERGAGETLACGTGACAAVVAGIHLGWLDADVRVHTRGGDLRVLWAGLGQPVWMSGPAEFVFDGAIDL